VPAGSYLRIQLKDEKNEYQEEKKEEKEEEKKKTPFSSLFSSFSCFTSRQVPSAVGSDQPAAERETDSSNAHLRPEKMEDIHFEDLHPKVQEKWKDALGKMDDPNPKTIHVYEQVSSRRRGRLCLSADGLRTAGRDPCSPRRLPSFATPSSIHSYLGMHLPGRWYVVVTNVTPQLATCVLWFLIMGRRTSIHRRPARPSRFVYPR
jgi:hypothetical protein